MITFLKLPALMTTRAWACALVLSIGLVALPACSDDPPVTSDEEICDDTAKMNEDDANGANCADTACVGKMGEDGQVCQPAGETTCNDGFDNNNDGKADCADSACAGETGAATQTCEPTKEVSCADGFDNNGDGKVDCGIADDESTTDVDETKAADDNCELSNDATPVCQEKPATTT